MMTAFEFAGGLASALPGTDPLVVALQLAPLQGRVLLGNSTHDDPFLEQQLKTRRTAMGIFQREWTLPREELKKKVATQWIREEVQRTWRPVAADTIRGFFERFGWDPGEQRIRTWANL